MRLGSLGQDTVAALAQSSQPVTEGLTVRSGLEKKPKKPWWDRELLTG